LAELKPLSKKDEVFISEYLKSFNATEAYLKVHPKAQRESAWVSASRLLSTDKVKNAITERLLQVHMSADEALKLQSDIARGDITSLMDDNGQIDIKAIKRNNKGKLIKKIKQRTTIKIAKKESDEDTEIHETEIELYAADVAQERILKITGKIKDPQPVIKAYIGLSPDDWDKVNE